MISPISGASGYYMAIRPAEVEQSPLQEKLKPSSSRSTLSEFTGLRTVGPQATTECQTCKNRRYQDQSNDSGVSFQSPTALTPGEAETAVRSHEGEHVARELARAKEDGKTAYATVSIHTEICPECGRVYISGGTTRVVTKKTEPVKENSTVNELRSPVDLTV